MWSILWGHNWLRVYMCVRVCVCVRLAIKLYTHCAYAALSTNWSRSLQTSLLSTLLASSSTSTAASCCSLPLRFTANIAFRMHFVCASLILTHAFRKHCVCVWVWVCTLIVCNSYLFHNCILECAEKNNLQIKSRAHDSSKNFNKYKIF